MVLTSHGKALLSKCDLNFCYWAAFDDEIDYDPFITSSSLLSEEQLLEVKYNSIEDTPIRQATNGYKIYNRNAEDFTNLSSSLFTMSQGQEILPRAKFPEETEHTIKIIQRRLIDSFQRAANSYESESKTELMDRGVERIQDSSNSEVKLTFSYERDSFQPDFQPDGFFVTVYKSGSDGLTEITPMRDSSNDLSLGSDIKVHSGFLANK